MRRNGHSIRDIAATLGRGVGTISDELNRNKVAGTYNSKKAHAKSQIRRKAATFQGKKVVANKALRAFVEAELLNQQSPSAIAGRLATDLDGLPYASRDTIEQYIRSVHGRRIEYELKLLKRKRKKGRKKRPTAEQLQNRTSIDDRPSVITNRERVGDVEADFIVSGKNGSGYLLTVVDRKIRVGFIRKLLPVTITNMEQAFLDVKKAFSELKSITTDNDLLFRHHRRLEALLGVSIYFCDPYSSWQKGSVENLNKQVRKYIPKSSDISQYNDEYIQFVQHRLNSRFMSVLSYKTPQECLAAFRNNTRKEESR
jgi:IS30 family transposase